MLSKEEKEELLKLAKSEKLRKDFRRLESLNRKIGIDLYIKFLTNYSKIFENKELKEYIEMRFRKFKQARKFLL